MVVVVVKVVSFSLGLTVSSSSFFVSASLRFGNVELQCLIVMTAEDGCRLDVDDSDGDGDDDGNDCKSQNLDDVVDVVNDDRYFVRPVVVRAAPPIIADREIGRSVKNDDDVDDDDDDDDDRIIDFSTTFLPLFDHIVLYFRKYCLRSLLVSIQTSQIVGYIWWID